MDFRRIPFQFTSTDPAKRQAELQKRFGLPSRDKMYIDLGNPGLMAAGKCESNSASSSPRLQHRVPIFTDGLSEVIDPADAPPNNVDVGRKPRVRVVPIEIEGADKTKRHRTASGPAGCINGKPHLNGSFFPEEITPFKGQIVETTPEVPSKPQVRTIPIKIENTTSQPDKLKPKEPSPRKAPPQQKPVQKNGCNVSTTGRQDTKNQVPVEPDFSVSLKKIEAVLERLKGYGSDVEKFSGTAKEKQYRYLDEMLTRCMLDLDNVDTMGNENVRLSRKAAIKKVQHYIDLLESKLTSDASPEESVTVAEPSDGGETLAQNVTNCDEKVEDIDMVSVAADVTSLEVKETVGYSKTTCEETGVQLELDKPPEALESKVSDVEMEESSKELDVHDSEMIEASLETESNSQVASEFMELDQDTQTVPVTETTVSDVTESSDLSSDKLTNNLEDDNKEQSLPTSTDIEAAYIVEEPSDTEKETSGVCEHKAHSGLELIAEESVSEGNTCITEVPSVGEVTVNNTEAANHSIETVKNAESISEEQCPNFNVVNSSHNSSKLQSESNVKS